ncbi:GNAT family N-acetyltransferase [Microbaculum marinum]|uniref:GNAT family N-acetyltransferase n=1 Tax=Microbaculum marinum TaxID=1764581 RepID=A0AAW9RPA8_9HYPH
MSFETRLAKTMSTPEEIELRTDRLLLRPLRASDAPAISALAGDERVSRHTASIPHPYPDGAADAFIADAHAKAARGEGRVFAIALSEEPAQLIGVAILRNLGSEGIEVGYWLGVGFWGRGLMSEAVAAAAAHARSWLPGAVIHARTFPENAGSQRVLQKAGFRRRGTVAFDAPERGRHIDDAPLFVFEPDRPGEAPR